MKKYLPLFLRITVAVILIQTLRFKFTAHPDSVYIFNALSLEPFGRILTGILELIAGILLIFRKTAWLGAFLALGVIGGAILSHVFILGIEINNDKGLLFFTAVFTFIISFLILYLYRKDILLLKKTTKLLR